MQLIMMPSTKFIVLFQHLEQQLEGILDKYTKLLFQLVDSIGWLGKRFGILQGNLLAEI